MKQIADKDTLVASIHERMTKALRNEEGEVRYLWY
jgi:hypothetical protein